MRHQQPLKKDATHSWSGNGDWNFPEILETKPRENESLNQEPILKMNMGGKNTRQTEEEVGRQHQGMDRPGVRQVLEGSGERAKTEETGCEIICGAPTTLAVKG